MNSKIIPNPNFQNAPYRCDYWIAGDNADSILRSDIREHPLDRLRRRYHQSVGVAVLVPGLEDRILEPKRPLIVEQLPSGAKLIY